MIESVSTLGHLMVVGGTFRDWAGLGEARWQERVEELGSTVAAAGGSWLTLRAYERGDDEAELKPWSRDVVRGQQVCTVIVDPCADGQQRFADAMAALDPDVEVNEATVASALYEPADSEPDVVLILGLATQLPPSLVWELAYAELVFCDIGWDRLAAEHVVAAIDDFSGRRRRFGGLDP
jgi:undecaprenyl diphosphate synthase